MFTLLPDWSARLIGQYDPAQVLADGYVPASLSDGPLLRARHASRAVPREMLVGHLQPTRP